MKSKKAEWEAAYHSAKYELLEPLCTLKIGYPSPKLLCLAYPNLNYWAWITAFNPGSSVLAIDENLRSQARLEGEIIKMGKNFLKGVAKDPKKTWPDESSILILEIQYAEALELARTYGQNAFLFCQVPGEIRLEWTEAS